MTLLPYEETRRQGTVTFPCTMYIADCSEIVMDDKTEGHLDGMGRGFYIKPHWHDAFEILHFEKGCFEGSINMERFHADEEAFGFVGAGMIHTAQCPEGYLEQAVLFEPEILSFTLQDAASRELLDPFIQRKMPFPALIREGDAGFEDVKSCFAGIRKTFEAEGIWSGDQLHVTLPDAQLQIKAGLLFLLSALARSGYLHPAGDGHDSTDDRVEAMKKVMMYIRDNCASRIYISELAKIMNLNEQYFCRLFKRTIGKTPVAYINEIRIRKAAVMLERSSLPVAEIANECGFGNIGHFITEFRKQTGAAPLEYRKARRQAL